ncbi:hypothetical protein V2J09_006893 [Rumex salicifolius]
MGCTVSKPSPGAGDKRPRRGKRPEKQLSVTSEAGNSKGDVLKEKKDEGSNFPAIDHRRWKFDPHSTTQNGWPAWLAAVIGDVINDFTPRRASSFEKLDKIGQGTYSNVYKARDLITGKVVALKKVRFDTTEPESVKFMAREILVLRRLNHPNVIKLEGLVTSRMSSSLYLVFEYMEHDLTGLTASLEGDVKFSEPQVKCYMKQLFSGLEHCHRNGVLHRDIKGSNLLIDDNGILKIADFGLANIYDPGCKQSMTSRVVTLWYRPPELLLGATYYGASVDLWSAGCILAELLTGKPILPGRTEVEQLHKIFKLCGSPTEEYWKKHKLPNATLFKPQQPYKRCVTDTFKDFPSSSLPLVESLLSIDPDDRVTAAAALNSEFFTTEPLACDPSSLPHYPPTKEMDIKLRDQAARRQRNHVVKMNVDDGVKRVRPRERTSQAVPAPEANAEIQSNVDMMRIKTQGKTSKSEKFPPPHQDGAFGIRTLSFDPTDSSFDSTCLDPKLSKSKSVSVSIMEGSSKSKKPSKDARPYRAPSRKLFYAFKPSSIGLSLGMMRAYGMGMSAPAILSTGASRYSKLSSTTDALW